MKFIIITFILICFVFFIIPSVYLIISRNHLLDIERNNVVLFNEICGGQFDTIGILDLFHNNILAVRLTLYKDFLVISYRKKIILKYSEIKNLTISGEISQDPFKPSLKWKKLSIEHEKENISKKIFLYLSDCEKIKQMIINYSS